MSPFLPTSKMPSSKIIIASAGSGKTRSIIDEVAAAPEIRCAAITYTNNSRREITDKAISQLGHLPPNLHVDTWYSFLLKHFIRPYQRCMYQPKITRLQFVNGRSDRFSKSTDIARHYFNRSGHIYLDKVSKFACQTIERTGGEPLARFARIFDRLYVDESQDLAGYDLDLIEAIMKHGVEVVLVGDHRQATFSTNNAGRHNKFRGPKIIDKFHEWEKQGLCEVKYQNVSHRCVQDICDFADRLNPELPVTESLNKQETEHDGVFLVRSSALTGYFETYAPQTLRYNRRRNDVLGTPINFGEAKGMTFPRTLIYPHGPLQKYLASAKLKDAGKEIAKIYVACTRARQSTAFVVPDNFQSEFVPFWQP